MQVQTSSQQDIESLVKRQHDFFRSGKTHDYVFRIEQLKKLEAAIQQHETELNQAFAADLGKPLFEIWLSEIGFVLMDLNETLKKLKKWMRPRRIATPLKMWPAQSRLYYQPLGVNLIIAPFNYPFGLTFAPLIAAMAAGNTAVVKTSELTPAVSAVIRKIISSAFAEEYIAFVDGAIPETTTLLQQPFDHIFFTGSPRVGKIVMTAAAKQLTPVTLELGGKSPCVVHHDANLEIAVKRIVYGKFLNAGQTCIAPDYVMLHADIHDQFVELLQQRIEALYAEGQQNRDYGRVVSEAHLQRLLGLIDNDKLVMGGQHDIAARYLAPTVLRDVTLDDAVMQEEIFGPVLPLLVYHDLDEVTKTIEQLPAYPLAGYIFTASKDVASRFVEQVRFGGGCINHVVQHVGNLNLPFGGVGESGIGNYHGFAGFRRFSHEKSIFRAVTWFDMFSLLYPPYTGLKYWLLKKLLK